MKRILLVFLTIITWSCSSDDSGENPNIPANFDDADGDGVEFIQERRDNTNPNAPCDYLVESQIYEYTSTQWRESDCDGDGVNNGEEVDSNGNGQAGPDGTDPRDFCDYNPALQNYANTTTEWQNKDCDGDGVTNGDEIDPDGNGVNDNNGTNSQDWCSFNISEQTIDPFPDWYYEDCDGDCQRNLEELANGTNLLDPNSFYGGGNELTEIWMTNRGESVFRRFVINTQFNRLETIYYENGGILSQFTYDNNNRLIEVFINVPNSSFDETITYSYSNNQISQITIEKSGTTITKFVTYNGNEITTSFSTVPGGNPPFSERYEINPANGRVLYKEAYYLYGSDWRYASTEYTYDANGLSLLERYSSIFRYDLATGNLDPTNDFYVERYEYDNISNPAYDILNDIYLNIILEEDVDNGFWNPVSYGLLSERFCTRSAYARDGLSAFFPSEAGCVQNNGLIYKAFQYNPYNYDNDIDYIYQ